MVGAFRRPRKAPKVSLQTQMNAVRATAVSTTYVKTSSGKLSVYEQTSEYTEAMHPAKRLRHTSPDVPDTSKARPNGQTPELSIESHQQTAQLDATFVEPTDGWVDEEEPPASTKKIDTTKPCVSSLVALV